MHAEVADSRVDSEDDSAVDEVLATLVEAVAQPDDLVTLPPGVDGRAFDVLY